MTATVEQVETLLGRDIPDGQRPQVEQLIAMAETYLYARVPDLQARIDSGRVTQETVDLIEASMVARVLRNPDGFRSEQEGAYSYQLDTRVAAGFLTLLPDELTLLGLRRGAFTITPSTAPTKPLTEVTIVGGLRLAGNTTLDGVLRWPQEGSNG